MGTNGFVNVELGNGLMFDYSVYEDDRTKEAVGVLYTVDSEGIVTILDARGLEEDEVELALKGTDAFRVRLIPRLDAEAEGCE